MVRLITRVSIAELVFGVFYAWLIYYHPIKRIHVSAMIGTSAIALASSIIIAGTLHIHCLFRKLWFLAAAPWFILGLAGIPVAITQEIKWREMNQTIRKIEARWREFE